MANRTAPLTPEEVKDLEAYLDKKLDESLETGPVDREKAESAINGVYLSSGLPPPKQIIWASSAMSGILAVAILQKMDSLLKEAKGKKAPKFPF